MNEIRDQEYFIEKEKLIVLPARINKKNCSIHWERLKWNTDEEINEFQCEGTVRVCVRKYLFFSFILLLLLFNSVSLEPWNLLLRYRLSFHESISHSKQDLFILYVCVCMHYKSTVCTQNQWALSKYSLLLLLLFFSLVYRLIISIWIIFHWFFRCICLQQADKVIIFRLKMSASQY